MTLPDLSLVNEINIRMNLCAKCGKHVKPHIAVIIDYETPEETRWHPYCAMTRMQDGE